MNQLSKILVHSCLQLRQLWFCLALMLAGAGMAMAQTPQAIWTAGNTTLTFVNSPTTYAAGDTFNEQAVTAVWSGTDVTASGTAVPAWNSTVKATLTKVVFDSSFSSVRPKSLSSWFNQCRQLTAIEEISNLNTSEVRGMSSMFNYCSALTSLDLSNFDTRKVTTMTGMFSNCSSLTSLDLSNFDTSIVTNMSGMFLSCFALTSLNLSNFNTSNVTNMSRMFQSCSRLTSLDLSNFNTSNVKNMSNMFRACSSLTSPDVSSFNTSKVTTMSGMFSSCRSLTTLDVSNFDTSNVTDMSSMFMVCNVTSLDLSNFDTSNVTAMDNMFNGSVLLTTIICDSTWTATNSSDMFAGCTRLVGGLGTAFNVENPVVDATYARVDDAFTPGYFTPTTPYIPQAIWTAGNTTLTFISSPTTYAEGDSINGQEVTAVWSGTDVADIDYTDPGWWGVVDASVTKVVFDQSFQNVQPTCCCGWFEDCTHLTEIVGLEYLDTSNVTDMCSMFYNCSSLTSLDLSHFDTGKVTDMNSMFSGCTSLTSLDVSSFNTGEAQLMIDMFYNCSSLTSLDLSHFDTGKVTDMSDMFSGCSALTSLDLSNFDTSSVDWLGGMFNGCTNLTTIYCDGDWTHDNYASMFSGCTSLVGEYGTSYTSSATDGSKANPGEDGYFTLSKEVLTARDGGDGWYYTTYYNGEHSRFVDNNTEVYVAQADWDNNSIILELNDDSVDKRLLKDNAFILRSKQPTITLSLCDIDGGAIGGALASNQLEGSAKTVEDFKGGHIVYYTLGKVNGVLGFYEYTGNTLNARKAFLKIQRYGGYDNAPLRFSFDGEDTTTGIEASTMDKVQSTSIFDLQGRRVVNPTKGIYIVNGKKVFMK